MFNFKQVPLKRMLRFSTIQKIIWLLLLVLVTMIRDLSGQKPEELMQNENISTALQAESFFLLNLDSIRTHSILGIANSKKAKDSIGLCANYLMLANYHSQRGASPDTISFYINKAQLITSAIQVPLIKKWYNLSKGELYHQTHHYERSIKYYLEYVEHCTNGDDNRGIAYGHLKIGQALRHIGMFEQAIGYHNKAWKLNNNPNDSSFFKINLDYLALALEDNQQADSASTIRNIAKLYTTPNDTYGAYYQNADMAFQFWNKSVYDSTLFYFKKSLSAARLQKNLRGIIENLGDLAMMEESFNHTAEAEEYWTQFAQFQSKNIFASNFYLPYRAKFEKRRGNLDLAFELTEQFIAQNRNTFNKDMARSVAEQIAQHDLEFKEKTLSITSKKLAQRSSQRNFLLLLLTLGGAIGFFIWRQFYLNQKINLQEIQLTKQQLELQNQEIGQLKNEQQVVAMRSMIKGQESERSRIARELHDGIGGYLSALKLSLTSIKPKVKEGNLRNQISSSAVIIDNASRSLRRIAQDIMPESLSKFSLIVAIEDLVGESLLGSEIKIDFQNYNLQESFPDQFKLTIFRIIQELIHNVIKHAEAGEIIIQLIQHGDILSLTVEDDGKGFDVQQTANGAGFENIKHRVTHFDGKFNIESEKSKGTTISINCTIPNTT